MDAASQYAGLGVLPHAGAARHRAGDAGGDLILTLVVAASDNDAIGRDNALPWHLPADLQRFKQLTLGKPVLMGRRTHESIGRPLPGRRNLVLSRGNVVYAGVETVASVAAAMAAAGDVPELMVIGGAQLYREVLSLAGRVHLTRVHCTVADADVFFPRLDASRWQVVESSERAADERNPIDMTFTTLERAGAPDAA